MVIDCKKGGLGRLINSHLDYSFFYILAVDFFSPFLLVVVVDANKCSRKKLDVCFQKLYY